MVRLSATQLLCAHASLISVLGTFARGVQYPAFNRRAGTICQLSENSNAAAPSDNIWAGFDKEERKTLEDYLNGWLNGTVPNIGGNFTIPKNISEPIDSFFGLPSSAFSASLARLDMLPPKKADALAYLSGSGPVPPRYAQFIAEYGYPEGDQSTSIPDPPAYLQNYAIGPLPLSSNSKIVPMDWDSTRPGRSNVIYKEGREYANADQMIAKVADSMNDILIDLVGANASTSGPFKKKWVREQERDVAWVCFSVNITDSSNPDSIDILQQGLYLKIDVSGKHSDNATTLLAIVYNSKVYKTIDEFRAAWKAPGFEKLPLAQDGPWTSMDQEGEPYPYDTESGPQIVNPTKRYAIDMKNNYLEWMGFSFYMSVSSDLGLALYNINYQKERIIYELQMQEALAIYASNDPLRAQTYYLDTTIGGFGETAQKLVPGWDCPESASYIDTPYIQGGICIFERDAGFPLSRHSGQGYITVVKNNILVLRTVSTIGNYDYIVEYQFFYDGSIEVTVRASGYIEGTYAGGNEEFGYRIHDALSGAMHDHVINFKLDLDINGTANTLERVDVKPVTTAFPGSNAPINTMHVEKSFITNEEYGKIDWAPNAASMFVVVNKDAKNPYGECRGYRIAPGVGSPAHITMPNSTVSKNSANWSKNHFYVTKRKDTEPRSASYMNKADYEDSYINFDEFFDGENIEQEDLVVWFNVGMHHVPHTGDLPVTIFQTAQASLIISPHNYHLGSPSKRVTQAVKIFKDKTTNKTVVNYNKADRYSCTYEMSNSQLDLANYMAPALDSLIIL